MKLSTCLILLILTNNLLAQTSDFSQRYPQTQKELIEENYFGNPISDPYRWLEDDNSAQTAQWVKEQNNITQAHIKQIPFRDNMFKQLTYMWNYTKYSNPFKEGEYYLFYKNDGLQNQSVLYIQNGIKGEPREFLNPNTINNKGTSSLGSVVMSKNQKYCAYSVSNAGSDWQEIYIKDVNTNKHIKDTIRYSKFSGVSWIGDKGFYYSGYDKPANESEKYSAKTEFQKIFFHQIGTSQSEDKLVYEDKLHPLMYKGVSVSEDERWLMLSLSEGTDGSELHIKDLQDKSQEGFKLLCKGFTTNQDFVDYVDGYFLIYSNWKAPNYRVLKIDPKNPDEKNWSVLIPEKNNKLDAISRVGNQLFCSYLENACTKVDVYDLKGVFQNNIKLPGLGTASGFHGSPKDDHTFYTYTSFNTPAVIYKYDLNTSKSELFKEAKVNADLNNTVVEQQWFPSKDGTLIPMFIYHRKDVNIEKGPHPVLMYGYGGFNISLTPSFSIPISYFVQQGGVYVLVNLRGGSEFGENWHQSGMLSQKQNVFDDFIGAAEYLIEKGITTQEKLAIHGRSNGGLLVGACMTQRPDLFKVALPGVGVLDMLRYHKFTVGWGWVVEYGSSDKEEDFNYLIKYSPLHNVKKGIQYPATLITTGDHDDRVVPAHSFKFAATLQEDNAGNTPMLIRIDTQAGHGAGKPTTKQIEEWTDVISFTMFHLGMPWHN